jgi:hypothetical protein
MLARRPGCAPQLQRACLVRLGCLLVRLPWCFSSLLTCLQGNDSLLRFYRAQPRAGPRGRFEGGDGWLVRGSPPTPMRDRLWWCGVRRGSSSSSAASSLFPRTGSAPTRRLTVGFAGTPGGGRLLPSSSSGRVVWTGSASSPSRSTSTPLPRLLLLRFALLSSSDDYR